MVANYTVRGHSFIPAKPRVWSDRQVMRPNFIRVLDLHPDGKRFAVFPLPDVELENGTLHVIFLLNFTDELRRRVSVKISYYRAMIKLGGAGSASSWFDVQAHQIVKAAVDGWLTADPGYRFRTVWRTIQK